MQGFYNNGLYYYLYKYLMSPKRTRTKMKIFAIKKTKVAKQNLIFFLASKKSFSGNKSKISDMEID